MLKKGDDFMQKCFICKKQHKKENSIKCPNCGAVLCKNCANTSKLLCPYCHGDVEN